MADKGLYDLIIDLQMNTAKLEAGVNSAVGILKRGSSVMGNVMRGALEQVGRELTSGLLRNLNAFDDTMQRLAEHGDKMDDIAGSFEKLGGSANSIKKAQDAIYGTASAFDLMQVANKGLIQGIPKLNDNFAKLTEFANRFANATGRDTVEVLNTLTEAISKGSNKALREFGVTIDDTGTKSQNMAKAVEAIIGSTERYAPLAESARSAQEGFNTALADAYSKIAIAVNNSDELKDSYKRLTEVINGIDWTAVGAGIASLAGSFASVASSILPALGYLDQFAKGLEVVTQSSALGKFTALKQEAKSLKGSIQYNQGVIANPGTFDRVLGRTDEAKRRLAEDQARLKQVLEDAIDPYEQIKKGLRPTPAPDIRPALQAVEQVEESKKKKGKKTNEELAADKLKKEEAAQEKLALKMAQSAAKNADDLRKEQADAYADGVRTWQNLFQSAISGSSQDLETQLSSVASSFAAEIAQALSGSPTGASGSTGQNLGASFARGILGLFQSSGGPSTKGAHSAGVQGPGQADGSFGGGGFLSSLTSMFGGQSTEDAHSQGIQGPGQADGSFGSGGGGGSYVGAGIQTAISLGSNFANASKTDKQTGTYQGTGQAAGGGAGAAVGAFFGGPAGMSVGSQVGSAVGGFIGRLFNSGGNVETTARHTMVNFLEKALKEAGSTTFTKRDGTSYKFDGNILEGKSDKFKKPNWGDEFKKQAGTAAGSFEALAETIKGLSGVTEDVAGQFAAILGENLDYNVDNARLLFQKLGLSVEQMSEQFLKMAKKGEISWLKYNVLIRGANDAAKEGLVAVGDVDGAMKRFIESGATGTEAILGLKNIFIEAKEAGVKNLDELRAHLAKTMDPKQVEAFMQALKGRGITSIEQVIKIDEGALGAIVGDMEAAGVKFEDASKKIEGSTKENTAVLGSNTEAIQELTDVIKSKEFGPGKALETEVPMASGGIVLGPTRTLSGEAGPEAILPLSRKGGKLGVAIHGSLGGGGGGAVYIDARGAAPGVEKQIRRAMEMAEDRAVSRVMRSMRSGDRRSV